ncbi:LacI family transcriptional regulator [Hypnocyclicus thermotrophus]|uniref:LacI family transcriptional regulator n=1 Tax=Hypnocyclicus thermotrophus TaxID=1627895 RepID=A0AA46DYY5_9FUSO|nr:trehalose repressor [Hypnocyclicus thermotrophus]TDT71379.1 LacI family transcriptional regulator [Hypnocyclicus thermotrophus]
MSSEKLIGVILPRIGADIFSRIIEGITQELKKYGYNIVLANTKEKEEEELKYLDIFQKENISGIIFFPFSITENHIKTLNNMKKPVVVLGREASKIRTSYVTYDDYFSAKEVVEYLISKGHKKIAYIGVSGNMSVQNLRRDGYIDALLENNLSVKNRYQVIGKFDVKSGYTAMKKILALEEKPTAVFAALDSLAFGAMRAIYEAGYKVPEDFSIVGIDDMETSSYYIPSLTSIKYNYKFSGESAAKLIIEKIENKNTMNKKIVISYELKERESVKDIN